MMSERHLDTVDRVNQLAARLRQVLAVRRHDQGGEKAAAEIAQGLSDIEESCHALLFQHIPRLTASDTETGDVEDILLDIGEELRHILYHINDISYFAYLKEVLP